MSLKKNIIYLYFKGKHLITSKSQYQYNHGQYLYFADLNLPQAFEVHFSNKDRGESKTQIGSDRLVEIPDEYFWNGALQIYAWVYLHDGTDDGETIYEVRIPLIKRAKPTDEEPLPVQQSAIDKAIAELNNAVDITNENADKTNADKTQVATIKEEVVTLKEEIDSTANTVSQNAQSAKESADASEQSAQNSAEFENDAHNYADEAKGYAQNAFESKNTASQKAQVATDASAEAKDFRDEAETFKNEAEQAKQNIVDYRNETKGYRDETLTAKNDVQTIKGDVQSLKTQIDKTATDVATNASDAKSSADLSYRSAISADNASLSASQFADEASDFADSANQSASQAEQYKNQSATNVTHYPKVVDGYWYVWDASKNEYVNTNVDARGIKGDKGDIGIGIENTVLNSDYTLTITFTDGTSYTTPSIRGEKGIKGDVGNGIASTVLNNDYTLTITFTDGTKYITPSIRGEKGEKGEPATDMEIHICSASEYDAETRIPTITSPDDKTFYLVPTEDGTSPDLFTEWVYVNNAWEMFGSMKIDLSGYLTDVKVNDTSIVENGVANIPIAGANSLGLMKVGSGLIVSSSGVVKTFPSDNNLNKIGTNNERSITPFTQHSSTFYGLAKAAGHDEKDSTLPLGQYSDEAKSSIQDMLDIPSNSELKEIKDSKADVIVESASGDIASFMTPAETNIKSLKVHFSPKQLGEGDPSPENVREIEGWDGVEINQYNPDFKIIPEVGTATNLGVTWTVSDDGIVTANGTPTSWSTCSVGYINVNGNETIKGFIYGSLNNITFNAPTLYNSKNETITWERNDNALHSGLDLSKYTDVKKVRIVLKRSTNNISMSGSCYVVIKKQENINKPFKTDFSFDWSSDVGTVYGGYVDLISGELVQKYGRKTFIGNEDENFSYHKTGDLRGIERHTFHTTSLDKIIKKLTTLSSFVNNSFPINNATSANDLIYYVGTPTKEVAFYINSSLCEPTVESFSNWLSENPIDFVYQLETPITHQLTPTQLSSFIGQNNFWSNADYVEIEYELKETEDIQKVRKKIILNQPHIETVEDDLVNFTTNMKAPLKECKVYFEPIQEGEGDPSPDNVRNITGWDGVNVYSSDEITLFNSFSATTGRTSSGINNNKRVTTNSYGTTINRTDSEGIKTELIITQTVADSTKERFQNGYISLFPNTDKLIVGNTYYFDADIEIISNPLNKLPEMMLTDDANNRWTITINDGKLHEALTWKERPTVYQYPFIEFYCNGCSFKLKNMVIIPSREVKTINWIDQTGTVYGGYVDLVKGELVAEWEMAQGRWGDIKSSTAVSSTGYYTGKFNYSNTIKISHYQSSYYKNSICNITNTILWQTGEKIPEHFYCGNNSNTNKGEAYIFGNYNDDITIQIIAKLAEPIHYSLTPQQLLTLKGTNNIWSNSNGQTEVKFWTH